MLNRYHTCHIVAVCLVVMSTCVTYAEMASCEATKKDVPVMTKGNLFLKKTKPLVIGHRGNPILYQENTLAGYKSLLELNVDGFETDILLTKDKKLVLFHDVNTTKLTGENHQISEMTYEEIKKLDVKKQLVYGDRVYNFTKTEKIPLLEDLLKEMKDSGLLMILEMKPSDPPYDLKNSRETGTEVAKMVKRLGLENQVVLSSFDPFKLYHARKELNRLNMCFLVTKQNWDDKKIISALRADLMHLEGLQECVRNISDADVGQFVLETSTVVRAIGASSLDMDYDIYNNEEYSNSTYDMFKTKYGAKFSYGAWTIYKMKFSDKELDDSELKIQNLIDNGVERLYADDLPRILKKLGRPVNKNSARLAAGRVTIPFFITSFLLTLYVS